MSIVIPAQGSGTTAPPVATDLVGTDHYQYVKLDLGAAGFASPLVRGQQTAANSLPVVLASNDPAVTSLALLDDAVFAEDAAHVSGDKGIFALHVANEAQSALAGDGDYIARATDTKGNGMVVGNVAAAATDAGAPVKVGGKYNATRPTYTDGQRGDFQIGTRGSLNVTMYAADATSTPGVVTVPADAVANSQTGFWTYPRGYTYNGTNWDRQRSVVNATDSVGTGISAVGIVGQFDDTSPGTVTENQFGNVRMSVRREVYVQLRDAAGNERGLNIDASGQLAITVASVPSHAVTNAGTFATQVDGAALTSLQLIDDVVYTDDTSTHSTGTSKGVGIMAAAVPTDAAVNANDIGMVGMSLDRRLHVASRLPRLTDVALSLDTNIYASGDLLADSQQIDAAFSIADGTGILHSIMVIDQDDQKAAFDIFLLSANVSMGSENSGPSISDADALNVLCRIPVGTGDYYDLGGVSVAGLSGLNRIVKAVSGTDDLYVAVVNGTGTPTYTATGVTLRIGILE